MRIVLSVLLLMGLVSCGGETGANTNTAVQTGNNDPKAALLKVETEVKQVYQETVTAINAGAVTAPLAEKTVELQKTIIKAVEDLDASPLQGSTINELKEKLAIRARLVENGEGVAILSSTQTYSNRALPTPPNLPPPPDRSGRPLPIPPGGVLLPPPPTLSSAVQGAMNATEEYIGELTSVGKATCPNPRESQSVKALRIEEEEQEARERQKLEPEGSAKNIAAGLAADATEGLRKAIEANNGVPCDSNFGKLEILQAALKNIRTAWDLASGEAEEDAWDDDVPASN